MLGIISFSDRISYNIKSNEHKDAILEQLNSLYNVKIIKRHHHNLDINNMKCITSKNHYMNLRSNGNRYYLYFTLYNDVEIIYFIDKKIHPGYQRPRIILGRGLFAKSLFKNTLLDGEMVKCNDKKWTFLINDILCYEGQYLNTKPLPERLEIIYNILDTQYTPDETIDVCNYKVKTFYYVYKESIDSIIDMSKKLNYTCRGIYMWPTDIKYTPKLYNFNESTIIDVVRNTKDKTEFQTIKDNPTIDDSKSSTEQQNFVHKNFEQNEKKNLECNEDEKILYLVKTNEPDIYKIYETEDILNKQSIGIALVQTLGISKLIRNAFKDKNVITNIPFKCVYDAKFEKWKPIAIIS
jgi:hypothetical protein